ncbi:MAG TPA: hypothetical protein VKB41_04680 [Steroidobacteraceae bacterium]|nr:hypothetical protein [Steroidobacteraceae bacterium]
MPLSYIAYASSHFMRRMRRWSALVTLGVCAALCGCVPLAGRALRAEHSSLGCMQKVRDEKVPVSVSDDMKHCIAAGAIARYCSGGEAWLASFGKEVGDLFGSGDAEWRDIEADRRGITCAHAVGSDQQLLECCQAAQR